MTRRDFRQQARERAESQARELEQQVRTLAESQWQEPVAVVYLDYPTPKFEVPGWNTDGTVQLKGKQRTRRVFGNILGGAVGGLFATILAALGGSWTGHQSKKQSGRVAGPENAQALELLNAARSADGPSWLVHTARAPKEPTDYPPSHLAVVTTAPLHTPEDNAPPKFVWQAAKPNTPLISPERQLLTWPDGSVFEYQAGDMVTPLLMRSLLR